MYVVENYHPEKLLISGELTTLLIQVRLELIVLQL